MKLLVVYNPQAGNGRAVNMLTEVRHYLIEKQLQADIQLTQYSGHAIELVAQADLSQYDAVIASGGDGTLFEVINGYYLNAATQKPPVGLIPNGTGNAFMKELELQKSDWRKAIDIIAANQPRELDVGRFCTQHKTYHFINMVGMGFVTEVAETAIPLKWMGNIAYTLATLIKLVNLKAQKFTLQIDGETRTVDGIFVEVGNSRFTGTSFLMAPRAILDDGLLDMVLLKSISRLRLLRLFTSIYNGSHVDYPEIEYIQAKKLSVTEQFPGRLIPDGEVLGATPVTFECLPKDIRFLWS